VRKKDFTLCDDAIKAKKFLSILADFDVQNTGLEWALLAVEALNKSFLTNSAYHNKVLKFMFRASDSASKRRPAVAVFEDFREHALNTLKRRCTRKQACAGTTSMYLLTSVVQLVVNCHLVDALEQLEKLKKPGGVDWVEGINEVRASTLILIL
jgi:hypothetical protein